jgi:phage gp16-like protein
MDSVAELIVDRSANDSVEDSDLPYSLALELTVKDRDTIAELYRHAEGDCRDEFALAALRIGVLALRQARGQIDGDVVRREAERMIAELSKHLNDHARDVERKLSNTFTHYFDPNTGRFNERIENLVKRDGDLERLLRAQIGNQDSELCRTLAGHIGEHSPLMKMLSPDQKSGLLATLSEIVGKELNGQSERILNEFSLNNQDGALSRLVKQLTDKHDNLGRNLKEKIDDVIKELSLDDERSFFSRMQQSLDKTSKTIDKNLTLDDESSSLARLQREVRKLLHEQGESNQKFQEEVKTALAQITARKKEAAASTRHGITFQDAVGHFLQEQAQRRGDLLDVTTNKKGLIPPSCKTGDFVWELGPEAACPGEKFVVEAKEEQGYSFVDARKEIAKARDNRAARIGLFVYSKSVVPAGTDFLTRFGNDIFAIWDAEDAGTDINLLAGIEVARALCFREATRASDRAADFDSINAAILAIEKHANSLAEIHTLATTIQNNSGKILDRVRISRDAFDKHIAQLRQRISDLESGGGACSRLAPAD